MCEMCEMRNFLLNHTAHATSRVSLQPNPDFDMITVRGYPF